VDRTGEKQKGVCFGGRLFVVDSVPLAPRQRTKKLYLQVKCFLPDWGKWAISKTEKTLSSKSSLHKLSRRPGERPATEQVHVEMIDGLAPVFARADNDAISIGEAFGARNLGGNPEQMAQKRLIALLCGGERSDVLAWNDKHMDRCLGIDVVEGVALFVLMDSG
jgi:hypothetical protein